MNKNFKIALIIGGTIIAILVLAPAILSAIWGWRGYGYGGGMMGPWMMGGFGGMWFMPVIFVLFWGLIIWGIVALVRGAGWAGSYESSYETSHSALEILKKRYAGGEINKAEFEEKKKDLV